MLRGILPKEYAFYDYFEKLMDLNVKISEEFVEMVKGIDRFPESYARIKELKKESNKQTQVTIDLLHRTFITPFDRDDIYELIKGINGFARQVGDAVAGLANAEIEEILPGTVDFATIIHKEVAELTIAVKGLRNLKKNDIVREKCMIVHNMEDAADDALHAAMKNLFKQKDLLLIFKWKEVYGRLEKSTDRLDKVATIIETIMIDNS